MVKEIDPGTLVGYANFPSTEYLETEFTDFLAFNVYLHREPDFRRYLYRLHSLAGNRPLVLTEFGIDSMREGEDAAGGDAVVAGPDRARDGRGGDVRVLVHRRVVHRRTRRAGLGVRRGRPRAEARSPPSAP